MHYMMHVRLLLWLVHGGREEVVRACVMELVAEVLRLQLARCRMLSGILDVDAVLTCVVYP